MRTGAPGPSEPGATLKTVATRKGEQNLAAVDPWTAVHLSAGLAFGLLDLPRTWALGIAVGYEIADQVVERRDWGKELFETRRPETLANALVDLLAFGAGHWLGTRWNRT